MGPATWPALGDDRRRGRRGFNRSRFDLQRCVFAVGYDDHVRRSGWHWSGRFDRDGLFQTGIAPFRGPLFHIHGAKVLKDRIKAILNSASAVHGCADERATPAHAFGIQMAFVYRKRIFHVRRMRQSEPHDEFMEAAFVRRARFKQFGRVSLPRVNHMYTIARNSFMHKIPDNLLRRRWFIEESNNQSFHIPILSQRPVLNFEFLVLS